MKSFIHKEGSHTLKLLDLGGGQKFRKFWETNFSEMHGMIFVIDAACPERFEESAGELLKMILHPMVEGKPVLILANKQDLPGALSQGEVAKRMQLNEKVTAKKWQIQECQALNFTEEGGCDPRIQQGVQWLQNAVAAEFERLSLQVGVDREEAKRKAAEDRAAAKLARQKKREAREAAAASEAADDAMKATEASQVAVPLKIQVDSGDSAMGNPAGLTEASTTDLPPLRHPKPSPAELLVSGSPLPQDPNTVQLPGANLPSPTKLNLENEDS
eukprot:TRINITY_DN1328_c0_g1_i2.p1 TRINITY_DN1328_c0_g1~~TRINITY_DN1328_c0_g1_i2.p1  ORF type:complete len:273 (-),score=68.09 TRINITY_DN1328_c0_g1_i2:155-973(-)